MAKPMTPAMQALLKKAGVDPDRLRKAKRFIGQWMRKYGAVPFTVTPRSGRRGEWWMAHKSTKKSGKWQLSKFDTDGPYGDTEYDSFLAMIKAEIVKWNAFDLTTMKPATAESRVAKIFKILKEGPL